MLPGRLSNTLIIISGNTFFIMLNFCYSGLYEILVTGVRRVITIIMHVISLIFLKRQNEHLLVIYFRYIGSYWSVQNSRINTQRRIFVKAFVICLLNIFLENNCVREFYSRGVIRV